MATFSRYFCFVRNVKLKSRQIISSAMQYQSSFNYQKTFPRNSKRLPKSFPQKKWWAPLWSGLLVEPTAKHFKAMGSAIWLFLYFITYANRTTGKLFRRRSTLAADLGITLRTVNRWLGVLKQRGYIETSQSERSLVISITKWKPIKK